MDRRTPIQAAVLVAPGRPLEIQNLYIDEPENGEVCVKVDAVGLCHSDLHYVTGGLPIETPVVLGHEISGVIVAVGQGCRHRSVGERVVVTISPSCGNCQPCVAGLPTQCAATSELRKRTRPKLVNGDGEAVGTLGSIGAFAEQILVREAAVVPIEDDIEPAEACLLGCCVETGFGAVVHGAGVGPLDTAAVIGCGGVGISAIQALRVAGASTIIAIDLFDEKLDQARQFGATHTIRADSDVFAEVHAIVPGGVSAAFEAVGRPESSALAFRLTSVGGTAVILGLQPEGNVIPIPAPLLIEGDRKLIGAYMGSGQPLRDVGALIAHHRNGMLNLDGMVTSRWQLHAINEGFQSMRDRSAIRGVITM